MKIDAATLLRLACTSVPLRFWVAVWVGCRMSADCRSTSSPAELRRGWAEKSISGERNIEAQMWPARRTAPTWARGAVPRGEKGVSCVAGGEAVGIWCGLTDSEVVVERKPVLLRGIAGSSEQGLVFPVAGVVGVGLWDTGS
jgi:hypothetical protein